ncbi:ribosomal RNA small subunit methyltransferase H [Brevifollis gellanilyticus]|uniref:Ribosomal RNA small subunit methyltransferase H n=1 Tax=Brevifollis gellanilyticus TaxID=748831 RepID=A0A512MB36_9BACT|nr:ribosomal RNA small subunit methyltransferase H [Brevifollis gellanilyticus]
MSSEPESDPASVPPVHKRRPRYRGKNPRRFEDKYKELNPDSHPDVIAKVRASGKTPAGQHVPIMVTEVIECLQPQPGDRVVDCTLGYGGHSRALWQTVQPSGHLMSLDADPIELARTEARLRAFGMNEESFTARRCNFAGLTKALAEQGWHDGVDVIFADLGLSSMQIDNPSRGFTFKQDGPLDMRMNPERGVSAAQWLTSISEAKLVTALEENSDEPHAAPIAARLKTSVPQSTRQLAEAVKSALPPRTSAEEADDAVRRVFQAVRIAVNEEFNALDSLLRSIPAALKPGGRVAFLTFHSGEDRRVKKAFQEGLRSGIYREVSDEVIRASMDEQRANPRSSPAKLRWALK